MTASTLDGDGRLPVHPLRVFRVDPGRAAIVRLTSVRYWGIMTHFVRGRSVYCSEEACPRVVHGSTRYYRGYGAAEVYQQPLNKWLPVCLELTEHLELDFRDRWQRGQVWEISRAPSVGKKHAPTMGALLEERDPNTFPAALDLVGCLLHLYHVESIQLTAKNPLPGRTMVSLSEGEAPAKLLRPKPAEALSPEEVREQLAKFRERQTGALASPATNGKHV